MGTFNSECLNNDDDDAMIRPTDRLSIPIHACVCVIIVWLASYYYSRQQTMSAIAATTTSFSLRSKMEREPFQSQQVDKVLG